MEVGMRDWLLIIGGLLIVCVLGHGLWVAWRSRRTDIGMRYERNIPSLDMDDIDLLRAELPSGGARVVSRVEGGERRPVTPGARGTRRRVDLESQAPVMDPIDQDLQQELERQQQTAAVSSDVAEPAAPRLPKWATKGKHAAAGQAQTEAAHMPAAKREPVAEPEPVVAEPDPEPEQAPLFAGDPIVARDRAAGRGKARRSAAAPRPAVRERRPAEPSADDGDGALDFEDVLVINVLSRDGQFMAGPDLVDVVTEHGMRYGDMNIFHRYGDRQIEFSMASALKPGTFDLGAIDELETPGVVFFMRLPGPDQPIEAFEDMARVARDMSKRLGAELKDERHSVITAQTLEHCRQRVREFQRRQMSRRN